MATATPDVTVELFALILDEDEPPCSILPPKVGTCSKAARWAFRCPGCAADHLACDEHRTTFDREMQEWVQTHLLAWVACPRCHTGPLPVPFNWRPI